MITQQQTDERDGKPRSPIPTPPTDADDTEPIDTAPPAGDEWFGRYIQIPARFALGCRRAFLYPSGPMDSIKLRQLAEFASAAADMLDKDAAALKALYEQQQGGES